MVPLCVPNSAVDLRRYHALLEIAEEVSPCSQPGEVLLDLVSRLRSVVPFDFVNFALCDPARRIMKMHACDGAERPREPIEIAVEETAVGAVWRNQTVLSIDDLSTAKQFEPERQWLCSHQIRSYCVLPLTTSHEKLGALGFGSKWAYAFNLPDIQFLRRVAEIAALCIDRTQPESVLAEERARLRLLLDVSAPQIQTPDLPNPVVAILGSIQKWAARDYVGVYLYDETSRALRLHMTDSQIAEKMAPEGLVPLDGTLAGRVFRSQRSVVLDHAELKGLPFASVKRGTELGVKFLYLAPLLSAKGPLGVLKVARREDEPFSSRDLELLEQVAVTVSPVFERAQIASSPGNDFQNDVRNDAEPPPLAVFSGDSVSNVVPSRGGQSADLKASSGFETGHAGIPAWFGDPAALLESEQLLTAYFNASKVGLCILDHDFRYLAINHTMAEMNGIDASVHLGKSVRDMLGNFAELIEPQLRHVLAAGQPILNFEISCTLPTRNEPGHWMEHYIPIRDATGKVVQVGVVAVEITEQKKLQESLRGVSETLREEKKRQQVIMEVSRILAVKWDAGRAFPQVSAYLRRVLRQEYAALALRDEKSGHLVRHAMDFPLRRWPVSENEIIAKGPGVKALRERLPLIFSRDELQGFQPEVTDNLLAEGLRSLCCVPLLRPKGPLGVLVLGSTRANAFKNDDLTLLNQVAAQLAIALENARAAREVEELRNRLNREKSYLEGETRSQPNFNEIIGESPALNRVLDEVSVVAVSDATVLLLGETGTGKGVIARAIHSASKRKNRNFVTLNCAAIPTGLLESELFGHEKGAFTGAVSQKIGRLELAHGGTLFLDEIGEIPLELQPKLLRVLQDNEFERLGGTKTINVDLRLIAATNRDLARSIAEKEFRSDLFYRLNVFPIRLPPLRERREDIPVLVRYFVRKFAAGMHRVIETIPSETMNALVNWSWPGNVRELENFVERSVILTEGTALRAPLAELQGESPDAESLESSEREHILRVLRETRGMISGPTGASRRLGIKRTTLQSKMQRLKITRQDYSDRNLG
jgi:formate hydrogenlyase transcriptional activator